MSATGAPKADPQSTREQTGQKVPGEGRRGAYRSGDRAEKRYLGTQRKRPQKVRRVIQLAPNRLSVTWQNLHSI